MSEEITFEDLNRLSEKFTSRISAPDTNGCWNWIGSMYGKTGYGQFYINKKTMGAHRAVWILCHGGIPDGLFVLHRCDNRRCVNPNHLFTGTQKDNVNDKVSKGRQSQREHHGMAKLLTEDVVEIRKLYESGRFSQSEIARSFSVGRRMISYIVRQENWQDGGSAIHIRNGGITKVTTGDVNSIRNDYLSGKISQRGLAKKYGISQTQIGRIVRSESR